MSWNWRQHKELLVNILTTTLVGAGAIAALLLGPNVHKLRQPPAKPDCAAAGKATRSHGRTPAPDMVFDAKTRLTMSVSQAGTLERRQTGPLPIQRGGPQKFSPNTVLCMTTSDFLRSDGAVLPASQITSRAVVTNDGKDVIVQVWVAPRYKSVSGFGTYSGMVSLNDARAAGAAVPVTIQVQYPYLNRIVLCGLLLAYGGLIWGLFVRIADRDIPTNRNDPHYPANRNEPFWANLALRVAVLATAVPILNAQALSNPAWTGSLSEYIRLGGLVGAAAIAATPSLRAIVSRVPG